MAKKKNRPSKKKRDEAKAKEGGAAGDSTQQQAPSQRAPPQREAPSWWQPPPPPPRYAAPPPPPPPFYAAPPPPQHDPQDEPYPEEEEGYHSGDFGPEGSDAYTEGEYDGAEDEYDGGFEDGSDDCEPGPGTATDDATPGIEEENVEAFGCIRDRPRFEALTAFGAPPEQRSLLSKEWQRMSSAALRQLPYLPASKEKGRGSSADMRKAGNEMYISCKEGLPPGIYASRLTKAIGYYERADAAAASAEDKASAAKNLGVARRRQAEAQATLEGRMRAHIAALGHFATALTFGTLCKGTEWCVAIEKDVDACIEAIMGLLLVCMESQKFRWLELMTRAAPEAWPLLRADLTLRHADAIHKAGVTAREDIVSVQNDQGVGDDARCSRCMHEVARPIEEALRYARAAGWQAGLDAAKALKDAVHIEMCMCESQQAVLAGDAFLESALTGDEDLSMDLVYMAADQYHQCIILAREHAVKLEALAHARLGQLHARVLKDAPRGTEYFRRCLELAQTLHPIPYWKSWHRDARDALLDLQTRAFQEEQSRLAKERDPILAELKSELFDLAAAEKKGATDLVDHIYRAHPPKKPGAEKPDMSPDNMVKGLRTAISHYHPDKNSKEVFGMKWCVLSEEITKSLNIKYGMFAC